MVAGAALIGRRPRRPLLVAVLGTFGFPLPCLLLALHAPGLAVACGAAVAGAGATVFGTFWSTVMQQRVAADALARTTAFSLTGAYAFGSAGYAVIGLVAALTGPVRLLEFGAAWGTVSSAVVLTLPAVRSLRWLSADSASGAPRQDDDEQEVRHLTQGST
jgi:hypothetical protein